MKANYVPHQHLCSPEGSSTVKTRHTGVSIAEHARPGLTGRLAPCLAPRLARLFLLAFVAAASVASALAQQSQTIDSIRVIGNRRIPKETVLARLFTHPGDTYDPISIERDFNSLWNTGYFENLRIEREDTEKGIILDIFVKERPTIREINYKGLNAISQSDVPRPFQKSRKSASRSRVNATRPRSCAPPPSSSSSCPGHGHQFATVKLDIKDIPPATVQVNFNIKEGPTVKVGANPKYVSNQHIGASELHRLRCRELEASRHPLLHHL